MGYGKLVFLKILILLFFNLDKIFYFFGFKVEDIYVEFVEEEKYVEYYFF